MSRRVIFFGALNLLFLVLRGATILPEEIQDIKDDKKRVFFLHSYDYSFPTFQYSWEAFNEAFDSSCYIVDIQSMYAKSLNRPGYDKVFYDFFNYRWNTLPQYDLLVLGDDLAFNFYLQNQDVFFNDIPAVFYGVNDLEKAIEQDQNPNCTGVVEKSSYRETIEMALLFNPEIEFLVAITDILDIPEAMTPFIIKSDESRFTQVFHNLIDNAIKHTSEGKIVIGYKKIRIKGAPSFLLFP